MSGWCFLPLLFVSSAIGLESTGRPDGEPCGWDGHCLSKKCAILFYTCANTEGKPCRHYLSCASERCQNGRCVTIAKGGNRHGEYCMLGDDCYSRRCHFFKDQCFEIAEGGNRGGQDCISPSDCYSGVCQGEHGPKNDSYGICSPKSATKGKVIGDGYCQDDDNCFSGKCNEKKCSKDSPREGKVGEGGYCDSSEICYSAHCVHNKCTIDSHQEGKSGERGYCRKTHDCHSGYCRSLRCVGPMDKITMNNTNMKEAISHHSPGSSCAEDKNCMSRDVCFGKCEDQSKAPSVGASCLVPSDCEPLKCTNLKCVNEPIPLAASNRRHGEFCESDYQCFSGTCVENECTVDSPQQGKSGKYGYCENTDQCYSGYCRSIRCVGARHIYVNIAGKPCIHNNDCHGGKCTDLKCVMDSTAGNLTEKPSQRVHGRPCSEEKQCISNGCFGKCDPEEPSVGSPCLVKSDCEPLKCDDLKCVSGNNADRWAMSPSWIFLICGLMYFW